MPDNHTNDYLLSDAVHNALKATSYQFITANAMIDGVVVGEVIVLLLVIIELSHACIPPPSPSNTQCFHTINTVAIADGLLRELSWRKSKSAAWIYLRAIVLVLSFSQCNESFKRAKSIYT